MLTPAQQAIFKADVEADQSFASLPHTADGAFAIAAAYQAIASPNFYVWRTDVTQDEIMQNGFDWTRVDNLSVGPARIWEWMFNNSGRSLNPAKPNVRAGIEAVWKGTAADLAVRAAIYLHCQRTANRLEKLFATGTGTAMPNGSPATMAIEGSLSYAEVLSAMGW